MKICKICAHHENTEFPVCPICGFNDFETMEDSTEAKKMEKRLVEAFTNQKLQPVNISFKAYSYKEQGDMLELDQEYILSLANGCDLKKEKPVWFNEKFASVDRDIDIELQITDICGKKRKKSVRITNVPKVELWNLGVVLKDQLKVQILLGDESFYVKSDTISLAE